MINPVKLQVGFHCKCTPAVVRGEAAYVVPQSMRSTNSLSLRADIFLVTDGAEEVK